MDILERQREWQQKQAEADRKWREEQAEKAERRHIESMRTANRFSLRDASIGFFAALAAVAMAYLLANWPPAN